jgi:class 3 adenylate cyclase
VGLDWKDGSSGRAWVLRSWLACLLLILIGAVVGTLSDYAGLFPALGGPNGLLYDLTLRTSQPWRRGVPTVPVVFVALDDASLARSELAVLPRALLQPIWARLIDGLFASGARRIAFDMVFAYAGGDFRVASFALPDYDRGLIDALTRGRERIVLGRFPTLPPAPAFLKAAGASRVGVLDVQLESDGRVRSTGPLARLPDGRIVFGFAALAAGWTLSQASSAERLLIAPSAPPADIPTYSLATLLDCLSTDEGARQVRDAVGGRVVVVGTAVLGEDEHRGPERFLGPARLAPAAGNCAPRAGLTGRPDRDGVPGALLQIAAIQSAASERPVTLSPSFLRAIASAVLALVFGLIALSDESPLTIGEPEVSPRSVMLMQLVRSMIIGLAGPALCGGLMTAACLIFADLWLPMGYPIAATSLAFGTILGLRWGRHRALLRGLYRTAGRYLPPARLAALARSGFADMPDGQEREVSILLADLVAFTSFSNEPGRTTSEVVQLANRYFTVMQAAIDHHSGCSDKFLGDAVLAFWNGLSDEPDHALKALATARDIIKAVSDADGGNDVKLAARVVVCSGRVYVGDLGAKQRSNFTIIGPAVNETFRLEKLPDHYGVPILVAASTADRIFTSRAASAGALAGSKLVRLDHVVLKGFAEPRSIYALVPDDDPGLLMFAAGRAALDQQRLDEGLALLKSVETGVLARAAKVVAAHGTAPIEPP